MKSSPKLCFVCLVWVVQPATVSPAQVIYEGVHIVVGTVLSFTCCFDALLTQSGQKAKDPRESSARNTFKFLAKGSCVFHLIALIQEIIHLITVFLCYTNSIYVFNVLNIKLYHSEVFTCHFLNIQETY